MTEPVDHTETGTIIAEINAQCERYRSDLMQLRNNPLGAEPVAIIRVEEAYAKSLERAAKAAGQLKAVEEHRLTTTLSFRRHVDAILIALSDFPDARFALIEALKS